MSVLAGWGRVPRSAANLRPVRSDADVAQALAQGPLIARGNGRAYGDAAINPGQTLDMRAMTRMLSFDAETGVLVAEAGVLLADIIATFLPRGWFPSVTPGTKFVSLGGAIAADVHGKNHHIDGAFGSFVDWIDVMGPDGSISRASAQSDQALFFATIGGMGLSGVILRAQIRLRAVESGWIRQETHPASTLERAIDIFEAESAAPYSVAWIDCAATGSDLGRSLVMLGRHATHDDLDSARRAAPFTTPKKRSLRIPLDFPAFALNPLSIRAFNGLYWRAGLRKRSPELVDWDSYFYPLDAILEWNRIYGRRGFYQFQCVLPLESAGAGLARLLDTISASGQGSFLAVLKRFGAQDSPFSFPMAGYTLALDFPSNDRSLSVMNELDRITLDHGGRFYLAKDGRMPRAVFEASDARIAAFRDLRRARGWDRAFSSQQSERLGL